MWILEGSSLIDLKSKVKTESRGEYKDGIGSHQATEVRLGWSQDGNNGII